MRRDEMASGIGNGEFLAPVSILDGWPTGWAVLACLLCAASWVGPVGESCSWCERRVGDLSGAQLAIDRRRERSAA